MLTEKLKSRLLRPARFVLCAGLLWFLGLPPAQAQSIPEDDSTQLQEMRALRRAAMRSANLSGAKTGGPALFGLLVIPVDFADARFPETWDPGSLTNRLTSPSGESLVHYFSMASRGLLELRITQAPVIHLSGTRRDYSDIDLNGFSRTRALATESLDAVRAMGLEFRRLDMEGPDRTPGTADDDGEVDGVLILHAGVGQENDPDEGLVQALQFFLDEPVVSQGVSATFYAVASQRSGPGIWAHETGHLLGLEDRYDHSLRPTGGSEVLSRGGLGRYSLMASGAWGTGDGYGAALPDAYSCLQLGWYEEWNLSNSHDASDTLLAGLVSGKAARLWTRGEKGTEYFLLETRDPEAAYPFDADIPETDLLIYHVDESLAEGRREFDGPDLWHLRVSLVEADNDFNLRRGEDPGRAEDQFPGPLGMSDFGPFTVPSSAGYNSPSGVSLNDIAPVAGGVSFEATTWTEPYLEFYAGFGGQDNVFLAIEAQSTGEPFSQLQCQVTVASSPAYGSFAEGQLSVNIDMVDHGTGIWRPANPVPWIPDPVVPADVWTAFTYDFQYDGGADSRTLTWYWKDNGDILDFSEVWPGGWSVSAPGDNFDTVWHHWDGEPWLTADQTPVLACTGFEFQDSGSWPQVTYQNSGFTTLTSGYLGPEVLGVRLIHALEVEQLAANVLMDGGRATWIDVQGQEYPAEPLSGYQGKISPQAVNVLQGQESFVQETLELDGDIPLWHTDIISVPERVPGPWRLKLSFASNSLWRYRGWFVAGIDPLVADPDQAVFEGTWASGSDGGLTWTWPWDTTATQRFIVQQRDGPEDSWQDIVDELFTPSSPGGDYFLPADRIYSFLGDADRQRCELRVLGFIAKGRVATRATVAFPDGGDGQLVTLSLPWPNPALGSVHFLVGVPVGTEARLGIFDLRGQRILERTLAGGASLLFEWDGRDDRGGGVAAGTYIIRLEGSGPVIMRKVVLLH